MTKPEQITPLLSRSLDTQQPRVTSATVTPDQVREALWYASHCCFCGFTYPAPHPFPFLADHRPHKRACYACLWCGPAILDEIPVPPNWFPPTEPTH